MRTMVRISNRDNSPIPSRMLEHRGADRAGLAIAVWHRNCPDSRDRGPRPRPRPDLRRDRDRARTKEERRGRARAIRTLRHDPDCPPSMLSLFHRLARLMLDMVRSPCGVGWGVVGCGLRGAIDRRQGRLGGAAGRRHFFCHVGFRVAKGFPGYRPVSVLRRSRC